MLNECLLNALQLHTVLFVAVFVVSFLFCKRIDNQHLAIHHKPYANVFYAEQMNNEWKNENVALWFNQLTTAATELKKVANTCA